MSLLLSDLPCHVTATVQAVCANAPELLPHHLSRLEDLGFLPGETVWVVQRGPGGQEPLAVAVGNTLFALRLCEARCITVCL